MRYFLSAERFPFNVVNVMVCVFTRMVPACVHVAVSDRRRFSIDNEFPICPRGLVLRSEVILCHGYSEPALSTDRYRLAVIPHTTRGVCVLWAPESTYYIGHLNNVIVPIALAIRNRIVYRAVCRTNDIP